MLKNKHFIIALLVTPVLALLAYFGVDALVKEQPHKAKEGGSYELVAKPNCRYASGKCLLKNGNFELMLRVENGQLYVNPSFELTGVRVGLLAPGKDQEQRHTLSFNPQTQEWLAPIDHPVDVNTQLRVVANAGGASYFVETIMAFVEFDPGFSKKKVIQR